MNDQEKPSPFPEGTKFEAVDLPPPAHGGKLVYAQFQVAALVLVADGQVASAPPGRWAALTSEDNPGQIACLTGEISQGDSVQDALVFAQAYKMRALLEQWAAPRMSEDEFDKVMTETQAVLEASSPKVIKIITPSAEEQLATARQGYDPSQTPDTSRILDPNFDPDA